MKQPSTSGPVALATFVLIAMTAAACGHSSPAAPDATASRSAAAVDATGVAAIASGVTPAAKAITTFPLVGGTFTISNRAGAEISGIYSGTTSESNGVSSTAIRFEVQNGTGALAGAAGVLEGKGRGAFTGEGQFSLDVSGSLVSSSKKNAKFSMNLRGWANIACSNGHVIISLHADGAKYGADMRHEVGNAGCGF